MYSLLYSLLSEPRIACGLLIVSFLALVLPSLRSTRVYSSATLFAGINAGIVATVLLSSLLTTGSDITAIHELRYSFTVPLPSVYLASLIIGATIVPRYLLPSQAFLKKVLVILGSLVVYHALIILVSRLIWMTLLIATEGFPSWEQLHHIAEWLLVSLTHPDPLALAMYQGPALGALLGTDFIMRTSPHLQSEP